VWQTNVKALHRCRSAIALTDPVTGEGFNDKGKKTLAHPDYQLIQGMWHPIFNQGKVPADFPHRSGQKVWLRCSGCTHECGKHHAWEARIHNLTQRGGHIACPYCDSRTAGFCPCRSVKNDPRLSREWHSSNPPAKNSNKKIHFVVSKGTSTIHG
jgi:DNA-directed RNA polymerase subunit RPC12/RpoP